MNDIDAELLNIFLEDALRVALPDILNRLNNGDEQFAVMEADEVKRSLANLPDTHRGEAVRSVALWTQANANGRAGQMRDLLGIRPEPPAAAEDNDLREAVISQALAAAAAVNDTRRRDELILSAVKHLACADPLVVLRWRREFSRLVDVDNKTFDALLSAARESNRPPQELAHDLRAETPTDDELADEWKACHPMTAFDGLDFRRYGGGVWPVVPEQVIEGEMRSVLVAAKGRGVRPCSRLLASVKKLAATDKDIFIAPERWDSDPDLLVCHNGALHIPTTALRPHSPDHYLTGGLSFDYDPGATAEVWRYFLDTTVPDAADFLQEFAGYVLTTDTRFEIAIWLCGPPASGKSTCLTGLQAMLGTRAGLLGLADVQRSSFALADLPGKTLVVSTEQPSSYVTTTHILNAIISGEPITVERKYRDAVTIIPRAKLAWAMNELPRVPDAGNGLFRRVKVVKFPPLAGAPDPAIKESIKQEGAGILNWALVGLARVRERGHFDMPPCVLSATAQFQAFNDVPRLFVAECCLTGTDYTTQSKLLYDEYKAWCDANGHKPQSSTSLAQEWERLGFARYRAAGKTFYRGVGLSQKVPSV